MFIKRPMPSFTLPAIYEEVLSYEEQVKWILEKFRELHKYVTETLTDIDKYIDESVANEFNKVEADLKKRMDEINKELESLEKEIEEQKGEIEEFKKQVEYDIKQMFKAQEEKWEDKLKRFYSNVIVRLDDIERRFTVIIEAYKKEMKSYADYLFKKEQVDRYEQYTQIMDDINNIEFKSVHVYNRYKVKRTSLGEYMCDEWRYNRPSQLTALKIDRLGLTAKEYDDLGMNAFEYDTNTFHILMLPRIIEGVEKDVKDKTTMFSPFTGNKQENKDVIQALFDAININGKNTSSYDDLMPEASTFDSSAFNGFEQDTNKSYTTPVYPQDEESKDLVNRYVRFEKSLWKYDGTGFEAVTIDLDRPYDEIAFTISSSIDGNEIRCYSGLGSTFYVNGLDVKRKVQITNTQVIFYKLENSDGEEVDKMDLIPLNVWGIENKSLLK